MKIDILTIFMVLGAIAIFIFGMKMMSEGVQRAAGQQMRNAIALVTKNKWMALFTGFVITSLIQSSSAATVMSVSFVNAGLLTVSQAVGIILGANIGTTVTGWIVSLFGFKIVLTNYAVPIFAIAVPIIFAQRQKWRYWGEFLVGFACIFLGLGFLRDAMPSIQDNPEWFLLLKDYTSNGVFSRFLFFMIGLVIAIVAQSSSVAMAITLTLSLEGWIPLDIGAAMILGENVGTTSTAWVASWIANNKAKIAARAHFYFNLIGAVIFLVSLPINIEILKTIMHAFQVTNIDKDGINMALALSVFHTLFNVVNALVFINFIPFLIRISEFGLKPDDDEDQKLESFRFLKNTTGMAELASIELQKDAALFGNIIIQMSKNFNQIINISDNKKQQKLIKKLKQSENLTDKLEIEITEYITTLTNQELSPQSSRTLRSVLSVCNELERIADLYYQLGITLSKKIEENTYFLPEQRLRINDMNKLLDDALKIMNINLNAVDYKQVKKEPSMHIEKNINAQRDLMREEYLQRLGDYDYNIKSAMIYNNVFLSLERIGDHIYNVTDAIAADN